MAQFFVQEMLVNSIQNNTAGNKLSVEAHKACLFSRVKSGYFPCSTFDLLVERYPSL